jgi:hypothetical protein
MRFTIRRMMIAVAIFGIGTWAFARYQGGWMSYAVGWWDAERELWRGEATIYALGGLRMGDLCNVDQDTGLPIDFVCGCVIGAGDVERVQGHNDHIEQYIRWHGPPKNTLKPWEQELFNLKRSFDERTRTEVPNRLIAGGPVIVSPDGRNSVRPVAGVKDDGSPFDDSLKVVIAAGNVMLEDWYVRFEKGNTDLLWGPEGSRFAVIRSVSEKREHYAAYDLRTGRHLRDESWDEGKCREERAENGPAEIKVEIAR